MVNSDKNDERVQFGQFELDLATLELSRAGEPVPLPLQPSKALGLLVGNAGSLVSREQLYLHLWPDSVVETEQGLNTCIRQLRTALGDDADAPVYIETVPRRGYRFIAPARTSEDRSYSGLFRRIGRHVKLLVIVAVAALVAAAWLTNRWNAPSPSIRLAVLPFQAIGIDEAGQMFTTGLSEELITVLAGIDPTRLAVIARTSSARFSGAEHTAQEIGRALRADFLLEGSVRSAGDEFRISARLIRVASDVTVWSEQQNRAIDEPISTQEWLASRVASAMLPTLADPTESRRRGRRAPLSQVRVAWLMAQHLLNREEPSEAERSIPLLQEVLDADRSFARAHVGLAEAFLQLGRAADANASLSRAFELDPSLPEAFFIRGRLRLAEWNLQHAGSDFERAARGAPSDSRIHDYYAYYLALTGQHEAARLAMFRAADIDPVSSAIFADAGLFNLWAGRPHEATSACEQALKVALPKHRVRAHRCLVLAYEAAGELELAREHAVAILETAGAASTIRSSVSEPDDSGVALTRYWQWAAKEESLIWSQGSTTAYAQARAAASTGDFDSVVDLLEDALEARDGSLVQMRVEPRFAPIRDDARFLAIARAVGVPE